MKLFLFLATFVLSQAIYAEQYSFIGKSAYKGGKCSISYDLKGLKISNISLRGETKMFELLAENQLGGVGPEIIIKKNQNFTSGALEFLLKESFWGTYYFIENISVPQDDGSDSNGVMAIYLDNPEKPTQFEFSFKGSIFFLTLAKQQMECTHLTRVN